MAAVRLEIRRIACQVSRGGINGIIILQMLLSASPKEREEFKDTHVIAKVDGRVIGAADASTRRTIDVDTGVQVDEVANAVINGRL